ncbi:hypothetical protein BK750_22835 [Bacillus thuringiensis serovar jegathesan]|uniref:Uncharacterized protein n=1 Tax=Bacillus thuringiensis subsp. jegathesan TaxID=56955 RepID=A0A9X6M168_BACTJ|nr:hypothetical protein BK750_22835 [Bacillus thuringiensis serovar jegathesan]
MIMTNTLVVHVIKGITIMIRTTTTIIRMLIVCTIKNITTIITRILAICTIKATTITTQTWRIPINQAMTIIIRTPVVCMTMDITKIPVIVMIKVIPTIMTSIPVVRVIKGIMVTITKTVVLQSLKKNRMVAK